MDINYPNEYTPTALTLRDSWNADLDGKPTVGFEDAFGRLNQRITDVLGLCANLELTIRLMSGQVEASVDSDGHKFVRDPNRTDLEPLQVD